MKRLKSITLMMSLMGLTSCTTNTSTSKQIYWVSGIKSECNAGAGKMECLQVSKNSDLTNANWQFFYAPIENFVFEEGFLKKIEVSEKKLNSKKVPADASSSKYIMVKELQKIEDKTQLLNGKWTLKKLINTPVTIAQCPQLEINLKEKRINGTGGCNFYFTNIEQVNPNTIRFGIIGSTQKMCYEENIENEYFMLLEKTHYFQVDQENLILLNKENKPILTFKK